LVQSDVHCLYFQILVCKEKNPDLNGVVGNIIILFQKSGMHCAMYFVSSCMHTNK